jgi:hypothetical protein
MWMDVNGWIGTGQVCFLIMGLCIFLGSCVYGCPGTRVDRRMQGPPRRGWPSAGGSRHHFRATAVATVSGGLSRHRHLLWWSMQAPWALGHDEPRSSGAGKIISEVKHATCYNRQTWAHVACSGISPLVSGDTHRCYRPTLDLAGTKRSCFRGVHVVQTNCYTAFVGSYIGYIGGKILHRSYHCCR